MDCDIENHHIHCYCKMCKRNLPYGTVYHNCIVGFRPGQIKPDMNPNYLINDPWWEEPLAVKKQDAIQKIQDFICIYNWCYISQLEQTAANVLAADLD